LSVVQSTQIAYWLVWVFFRLEPTEMREFKSIPNSAKASGNGRTFTGICAVFGHIDDWGDRLWPGAFAKTLTEGRKRFKHLWLHDFGQPPIASITDIKEVSREQLPAEILDWAPDATGGLQVTREYYDIGNPLINQVVTGLQKGDITEMSFGYDAVKKEFTTEGEGIDRKEIRELKEVVLYDTSDVLWGLNNATMAAGVKSLLASIPLPIIAQKLQALAQELKAGARNAATDQTIINAIHEAAVSLGCSNCGTPESDSEKAQKAEADTKTVTSLFTPDWFALQRLEVETM
jgi:HK97 family phage prohead protease